MKLEPRAIDLLRAWNGKKGVTFRDIIHAYKIGVKHLIAHGDAMVFVGAWAMLAASGNRIRGPDPRI